MPRKSLINWNHFRREPSVLITVILINALLILFVVFPLFQVFKTCFHRERWFDVHDEVCVGPVCQIVTIGSRSTIVSSWASASRCFGTVVGFACAYVVTKTDMRFKRLLQASTLLPIISPPFRYRAFCNPPVLVEMA